MMPTIWIDADSCPTLVRNHCVKMAGKLDLKIVFVANKHIKSTEKSDFKMVICSDEKDAADDYIFANVQKYDLVITRDILFAERLVEKGICAINDRGTVFTKENIRELVSQRNYDLQLAQIGLVKHYNERYDKKKFALFANAFDKSIFRLIRESKLN